MLEWRGAILQDKFSDSPKRRHRREEQQHAGRKIPPAWPVSCRPSFNSQANELAIESIELAHDGIEVQVIK